MRNIITFDLETQYTADEVGGWRNIRDMRLAVAVTYDASMGVYRDYAEQEVDHLIAALRGADLVIGYNVLRFDYEVLRAYTTERLEAIPRRRCHRHAGGDEERRRAAGGALVPRGSTGQGHRLLPS